VWNSLLFYRKWLKAFEYKNPCNSGLPRGMRRSQEFISEDLGEEDIVGLVFGFELVATDDAVG
jgi:hypothetical protein